jgi:citrate/tricarballylate utilization protein
MPARAEIWAEAERQLTVCNACRYCEGYCAVFPALERRSAIQIGDAVYLANLCHDCRACYQACMYAPPHELAIDIPKLMSEVRVRSYTRGRFGLLLQGPFAAGASSLAGLVVFLALVVALGRGSRLAVADTGPGAFYAVVPYMAMFLPALAAGFLIIAILAGGALGLWRSAGARGREALDWRPWLGALRDGLGLVYLRGGGPGCHYPALERPSQARRWFHQLVFWGFLADFVATIAAAVEQDVLGVLPPYPLLSVPGLLGVLGGLAMIVGGVGLIGLKLRAPARQAARELLTLDYTFIAMLVLASLSGLILRLYSETAAMPTLLLIHLGFLFGLYATAPYGKFAHAAYRFAALGLNRAEELRP